jgi:hypothetical protein
VAWKNKPNTVEAIMEMIGIDSQFTNWSDNTVDSRGVATFLFKETSKKSQKKEALEQTMSYYDITDSNFRYKLDGKDRDNYWRLESMLTQHYSQTQIKEFLDKNKGCHIRVYDFSDSGADSEMICHDGYPFSDIEHIKVGNH